jgi:hypothetical protein
MWSAGTDHLPFQSYEQVFGRRSPLYLFHQVLCFLLNISRFSSRRNKYDVDHFTASLSCYCASFKPDVSRRKLKVVCGLVYIVGFIAGYATYLPLCFMQWNDVAIVYDKVFYGYLISRFYFSPTIFMAVVYYKISQTVIKQNKHMKSICSNRVRRNAPSSSFNILKFIRNRRIFLVCLVTVLCYGIGNIPITVCFILTIAEKHHVLMKYVWVLYLANSLRVASSHSVNPLIYGILDKKLLTFWKLCRKKKQRLQGNW